MDGNAQPYDACCTSAGPLLDFHSLQNALKQFQSSTASFSSPTYIQQELEECETMSQRLLQSQSDLWKLISALESEVEALKPPKQVSTTISATSVVTWLYGATPSFAYSLRLLAPLPGIIYRYKSYKIVLEVTEGEEQRGTGLTSAGFRITAYSSKLPISPIEGPIITHESAIVTHIAQRCKVEIPSIKFLCTTKGCEFKNICLAITHDSGTVRPVVIEGVVVRARRKQKDPR